MRLIILLLALVGSSAFAQQDVPKKIIRVAALKIANDHHTLWLRTGVGKEPVEVALNTRAFSPPLIYRGPGKAAFYGSEEAASAEKPPPPLCVVSLKTNSTLLLFTPKDESYQVFPISEKDFPFGAFRFVNFSKIPVRAELGRQGKNLAPGKSETFSFSSAQNALPVRILAAGDDKKPQVIRQSSWSIVPTQRELILLFPNPRNGLVQSRHFVDSKSPES